MKYSNHTTVSRFTTWILKTKKSPAKAWKAILMVRCRGDGTRTRLTGRPASASGYEPNEESFNWELNNGILNHHSIRHSLFPLQYENKKDDLHRLHLVAGTGLEPVTFGLWAQRATNCSTPRYVFKSFTLTNRVEMIWIVPIGLIHLVILTWFYNCCVTKIVRKSICTIVKNQMVDLNTLDASKIFKRDFAAATMKLSSFYLRQHDIWL